MTTFENMDESWKDVPGLEGHYQVSNLGSFRSIDRVVINKLGNKLTLKGRELNQHVSRNGYYLVSFRSGGGKTELSHRVVATAFLGKPPGGKPEINHKNGDKTDNRSENLEWCSSSYNKKHAIKTGLKEVKMGEAAAWSKLDEEAVLEIRDRAVRENNSHNSLAREFGVGRGCISKIVRGERWKHVGGPIATRDARSKKQQDLL